MNELTKKKISKALSGRPKGATIRKKISQTLSGRKLTKEHKANISKAMKELNYKPQR